MNNKIRLGIIGCGRAAENIYLPLLKNNSEAVITLVVDPLKERREFLASGLKDCTAAESLNENSVKLIDAALITSPPAAHVELSKALLKCNKHLLVEKPLSLDMTGLENLESALSRSEAHLLMAFNHRYWAPVNTLKHILKSKTDSASMSAEIIFEGNYSGWNPVSFRHDALDDLGAHVFDLIRYIFEQEIYSIRKISFEGERYQFTLKTQKGNVVNVLIAHSDKTAKLIKMRINDKPYFISLGSVRVEPVPGIKRRMLDMNDNIIRKLSGNTSPLKRSYVLQFENFLRLIKTGQPDKPDLSDGIAAVKAVAAARLSLKTNDEVLLDEIR